VTLLLSPFLTILHLKLLEKQTKNKTSIRREIIKIKAEINEIEIKKP
jgi:hypothetical protein